MRRRYTPRRPEPKRETTLNSNIIIMGVTIFSLFACFALAGPLGLFNWLSNQLNAIGKESAAASHEGLPILLGVYTSEALQVTAWEIENFDQWMQENRLDKGISIAGTYMDFEFHNPDFNVKKELNAAWELGYTPFINLTAYQRTAEQVANDPEFEDRIRKWAAAYAQWSNGGKKRAFIAPLQEMNGGWVRYGLDPENFKAAWHKIQYIFAQEGVADQAVSWVFAPNAWSEEGHGFELYYPGDSTVDVLAFSTMNFGSCVDYGDGWDTFEDIYLPYLNRMREMAPGKPIFLSQMGTVAVGPEGEDEKLKNDWLRDTYRKLAAYPGVRAIIYYNVLKAEAAIDLCRPVDWRVFDQHSGLAYKGFLDAVRSEQFAYWGPDSKEMVETGFGRRKGNHYADIWPAQPFTDVEDPWYYPWVDALTKAELAIGCRMERYSFLNVSQEYEFFCPQNPVTRAEMAVFLGLAMHGPGYWPPPATGIFEDVPSDHWAAGWIEQLVADGLSSGCGNQRYCPDDLVSRAQMAVFLGKAKNVISPSATSQPTNQLFKDVNPEDWAAVYIEELAREGITAGCKSGQFCPEEAVSRAEMAVFLVKTFNIPILESSNWLSNP